jgi:hypothetical protein
VGHNQEPSVFCAAEDFDAQSGVAKKCTLAYLFLMRPINASI